VQFIRCDTRWRQLTDAKKAGSSDLADAGDQFSEWIKVAALEKQPTRLAGILFKYNLAQLEVYAKILRLTGSK
jgi:hypothetical protein